MFKVILLTVTFACCALAQTSVITKQEEAQKACIAEQPTDGNTENYVPINRACVLKCISEKLGFTNSSGDPIESSYTKNELPLIKKCEATLKEEDVCQKVAGFQQCLEDERIKQRNIFKDECEESTQFGDITKELAFREACFRECLAIKDGLLTEDGEIIVEGMKRIVGDDIDIVGVVADCKKKFSSSTGCHKSDDVMQCLIAAAYKNKE